jgi:hypothetical protein
VALTWDQVSGITKRSFIPKLADNIFDSNPFFERAKNKHLLKLSGGRSINFPLAYATTSSSGWYEGADTLNTADNEQITDAEYNWKFHYANVTIKRTDELKNMGDAQVLSLVRSKVELAEKTAADDMGTALWNDGTSSKNLHGLRHILATGNTVGGIDQSSFSWWQANVDSSSTVLTLSALQTQFNAAAIGSNKPSVAYTTRALYNSFWNLLTPQQRFQDSRTADAGFSSLMFQGLPVIVDSHAPADHWAFLNEKHIKLVIHKDENMRFEPFIKKSDQNVRVAKVYTAAQLCSDNNRMHALFSALAS